MIHRKLVNRRPYLHAILPGPLRFRKIGITGFLIVTAKNALSAVGSSLHLKGGTTAGSVVGYSVPVVAPIFVTAPVLDILDCSVPVGFVR